MVQFDRSSFTKKRHEEARFQKTIFEEKFPDQKFKYSQFLKRETPLEDMVVAYEVSYQVSYRGVKDDISISPQTFIVFGLKNQQTQVQERTMNMVLDSKGKYSKNHLFAGTQSAIGNNAKVQILPRGLEESQRKPTSEELRKVFENEFVVKELDTTIKMKNRKGREGQLDLDIRHFS